jgi:hypothetical protein
MCNSETDVQDSCLCALVTTRSDVRHYVNIRELQDSCKLMYKIHDNLNLSKFRGNVILNFCIN